MSKEEAVLASKNASIYFQKFEKTGLHHAAVLRETEWLLCTRKDQQGEPIGPQSLLTGLDLPDGNSHYVVAFPQTASSPKTSLTAQELYQVVQELVEGLYVFNQTPNISLESNHDYSSSCSIPSAYRNTLVGRTLLSVDYFIKSILHGTSVPQKEKRGRLNEEWRKTASEKMHDLYLECGMVTMEEDEELGSDLYKEKRVMVARYPSSMVDVQLTESEIAPHLSTSEEDSESARHISRDVFLNNMDNACIGLALLVKSVQQDSNLLVYKPSFEIYTSIRSKPPQDKDQISHLHVYLQKQRDFVSKHLTQKSSIAHDIELLGFISFALLLLITLKNHNKIVNCSQTLRRINKDLTATDRELPPFLPSKKSRWSPFTSENHYSSANGEIVISKQPVTVHKLDNIFKKCKDKMISQSSDGDFSTFSANGSSYYLLKLQIEEFYPSTPKIPRWVHALVAELRNQCAHIPTMNEARILDYLRKSFGPRSASKLKTVNDFLLPCIEKGLTSPMSAVLRQCTKTRIGKPNEEGLALIHSAAIRGRADIISLLLHAGADPNQSTLNQDGSSTGILPIHFAAQSGSLNTVACLIRNGATIDATDSNGWAPIHYAAFHNCHHVIATLFTINANCINAETTDSQKSTPLLLAGQNGGLDAVKCLVQLGANLSATDSSDKNIVHIVALKNHTNIMKFLADLENSNVSVWEVLTEMLSADPSDSYPGASASAIDGLFQCGSKCTKHLLKLKAISKIVALLKESDEDLLHKAVQVLSDISFSRDARSVMVESGAIPHLVKLLSITNNRIHSCTCLILCDLADNEDNQQIMTKAGVLPLLVKLLSSPDEDVQMNACACLGVIAANNQTNQVAIRKNQGIPAMVRLLSSPLMCVQGCAASSLKVLLEGCEENQLEALSFNIVTPLVSLLRSKSISVQCTAAQAMEVLANRCPDAQDQLLEDRFQCTVLLRRLLKARDSTVKVCGATALWALAGTLINNKRKIASFMGIDTLVDLVASQVESLVYVCSEALGILASELGNNQIQIARLGGIPPLTDVLLSRTSPRVYVSIMHTLSFLLTKPGLVPNTELQNMVANARGITVLSSLMLSPMTPLICVEAACTLAKLVLGNSMNESLLSQHKVFSYLVLFKFMGSEELEVRMLAGYAMSVFVFNNPTKLQLFKSYGNINISNFTDSLNSSDSSVQAHAAFQLVILSQLICGAKDMNTRVYGIKLLVQLCSSPLERTKMLCGEFLACFAHSRDGIPTATVMAGALDPLLDNFYAGSPPVIETSCAALGFFTHLPMASRLIRSRFRLEPELYQILCLHLPNINVAKAFLIDWQTAEAKGLPSLSLERRGGPAVETDKDKKEQKTTPRNSFGGRSVGKNYTKKLTPKADKSGLLMRRKESLAP